jgi:hypothetical protein
MFSPDPGSISSILNNNTASAASRAVSKKLQCNGREKGAFAYRAEEHLTFLSFIGITPNAFMNASEASPEWRSVHSKMVEVYQVKGVSPKQCTMLHSHFVELYSALKQRIRALLLHKALLNVGIATKTFRFSLTELNVYRNDRNVQYLSTRY